MEIERKKLLSEYLISEFGLENNSNENLNGDILNEGSIPLKNEKTKMREILIVMKLVKNDGRYLFYFMFILCLFISILFSFSLYFYFYFSLI